MNIWIKFKFNMTQLMYCCYGGDVLKFVVYRKVNSAMLNVGSYLQPEFLSIMIIWSGHTSTSQGSLIWHKHDRNYHQIMASVFLTSIRCGWQHCCCLAQIIHQTIWAGAQEPPTTLGKNTKQIVTLFKMLLLACWRCLYNGDDDELGDLGNQKGLTVTILK